LKQLIAQAAIDAQSPAALSLEFACPGQPSSMGWEADISIAGAGGALKAAPAAAGSKATDTAIKTANMVRPTAIVCLSNTYYPAGTPGSSNDEIASFSSTGRTHGCTDQQRNVRFLLPTRSRPHMARSCRSRMSARGSRLGDKRTTNAHCELFGF
jgi:hypothetical protein